MYQPTATGMAIASPGAGQLGPGEVVAAPGGDDQNSSLNKTTLMTGLVSAILSIIGAFVAVWIWGRRH